MKKIIFGIAVLATLSGGVWIAMRRQAEVPVAPTSQETGFKNYVDPEGMFEFTYPEAFIANGREMMVDRPHWSNYSQAPGLVLARVSVPREYLPHTNFADASLTIGWSNDPEAIRACSAVTNDPLPGSPVISKAQVSGHPFSKISSSEAAAGNRYDTTAYRGLLDGDCYSLEYTIHYGNIQNYDLNQGVTEFDEAALVAQLEKVVQSFRFLVNSD